MSNQNDTKQVRSVGRPSLSDEEKTKKYLVMAQKMKDYKREYYHKKLKTEHVCPMCDKVIGNRISFNRHQKESKACETEQLRRKLKEANDRISALINN